MTQTSTQDPVLPPGHSILSLAQSSIPGHRPPFGVQTYIRIQAFMPGPRSPTRGPDLEPIIQSCIRGPNLHPGLTPTSSLKTFRPGPEVHSRTQNSNPGSNSVPGSQTSILVPDMYLGTRTQSRNTSGFQNFRPGPEVQPRTQTSNPGSNSVSGAQTSICVPHIQARAQKSNPDPGHRTLNPVLY